MGRGARASCLAALASAVLLAACGGGDPLKSSTSTDKAPSSASSAATPAATSSTQAPRPTAGGYWPYAKLVARLSGRKLKVSGGTLRLDSGLLECNGDGVPRKTGSTRAWSHYTCTQTIFRSGADHDVTFGVAILSATELRITSPHNGAG